MEPNEERHLTAILGRLENELADVKAQSDAMQAVLKALISTLPDSRMLLPALEQALAQVRTQIASPELDQGFLRGLERDQLRRVEASICEWLHPCQGQ